MVDNHEQIIAETKTLPARDITLRRVTISDREDVFEFASDAGTVEYLAWGGVRTLEEAEKAITEVYLTDPGYFAIELKENGKCIGAIDLRMKPLNEKASFGYVLNKAYWNKGFMTQALSALLEFCFNKLELNRVESLHFAGNEGSGRVMEKSGMQKEGLSIEGKKIKGIFRDTVHYGITRQQWLANR